VTAAPSRVGVVEAWESERPSGVILRPRLVGTTLAERILSFLVLQPGATTGAIGEALRLARRPHTEMNKLRRRGLVRVEHGQVEGQRGVHARWWRV
jgi:hypothetical protein